MLNSPYVYQVELYTGDGAAIGRAPLAVDWEPAREWTRFASLCAGRIAPNALEDSATALPVWHARAGEPYVAGFRISMTIGDQEVTSTFGTEYFGSLAREVLEAVRDKQGGKPDAVIRYVTTAYPAPKTEPSGPARFVAHELPPELIVNALPIEPFRRRAVVCGESTAGEMPVFLPQPVLDEAASRTQTAGPAETGGILIGHVHRDPSTGEVFAEVTAQIPARHTQATATTLAFTPDTWTDVRGALGLRARGELMLGWWHSHPVREWCKACPAEKQRDCSLAAGFLSAHDRALHRAVFPRSYSVALVASDVAVDGPTFALFGWQQGVLERRGYGLMPHSADEDR